MDGCTLERLTVAHLDDLVAAADDEDAWTYMMAEQRGRHGMERWIGKRLAVAADHEGITWVIRDGAGRVVGSTSLYDHDAKHNTASVGYTWLSTAARGTGLNALVKSLVLSYAFDTMALRRVQFTVDGRNERSQRAMEKLGAHREGTLRAHRVLPDGFVRDTVVFSILADEWPTVRQAIDQQLAHSQPDGNHLRGELHV